MMAEKIKNRLLECASHMCFDYNGKDCGVDPFYIPEERKIYFNMWYGENTVHTAHDIDEVMTINFFDGKSLNEIADTVEITEW